jgi:hypothetical protein
MKMEHLVIRGTQGYTRQENSHSGSASVTPRIFAVEFFFFSLLAKIRALPFLFLFPSLDLDLFQSSSGIRFGFPV